MCRLAGWIGQPVPLSTITHDPPHALLVQARAPKLMREAALNADGWGAAWYPDDGDPRPVRYRVATPAWSDENLAALAPRTRSACMLGAVRSATPGMPFGAVTNQPFVDGRIAFVHNGYLAPFDAIRRPLRALLSEEAERLIVGGTDSEHLFALIRTRMAGNDSTGALVTALRSALSTAAQLARSRDGRAYLNVMLTNGEALLAARCGGPGGGGTLFVQDGAAGMTVASEPLSEAEAWSPVDDDTLLVIDRHGGLERISLGVFPPAGT